MLFDNRWNQHTCTSLTLLPFGLWAPDGNQLNKKKKSFQIMNGVFTIQSLSHSGTCRYILDIEILWFIFSPFFGFMHASTTVLV